RPALPGQAQGAPPEHRPETAAAPDRLPGQTSGAQETAGRQAPAATAPAAPAVAGLVRGPAGLMAAVRRLVRDMVVVGTLEDAEDLVAAHPGLTAVTAEGDVLGAHFAHGGSAGAPSLLEVRASVDEAAAELAELAVRCEELAEEQRRAAARRAEGAGRAEELGERRRAAERERSGVSQQLGRLAGQ
ncbi:chromosome segregation protein SMC, partial [Streptomyces sp. SID3915]|nr:chromosome segregation protein SMC [Streptomyces sp. SID3915]